LVLALLLATALALPAAGDAISDKRAEAERIARQLEQQSQTVSILAEDYDEARVRIETINENLKAAEAKVATTDAQAAGVRARLTRQAVESYIRGGSSQKIALLAGAHSGDNLAVRGQYIKSVTSNAVDVLDELHSVKAQLAEQRGRLDAAKADAAAAVALAESKRKAAASAEAAQRATLAKVQGELADLVAAEARRRAEETARRVQAELAARKARADAAARDAAARAASNASARNRTATPSATQPASGGSSSSADAPTGAGPPAAGADAAVAEAKRQIGKPYQYGSPGPDSFDCSGLTSYAWRAGSKTLPHSSRAQWSATSRVSLSEVQPGDILFYGNPIHHVGIAVGGGQMVEASETGTPVRYASIYRSDLVGVGRVN